LSSPAARDGLHLPAALADGATGFSSNLPLGQGADVNLAVSARNMADE
jgi:hypothetical protein